MGIIILIITVLLYETVTCYIVVVPADAEVMVNRSAYFNCTSSIFSQEVAWYRYRVGDLYRRLDVYDARIIDRNYRERFYIDGDKAQGVFNLVIRRVLEEDAGTYECQDDRGIGEKRSAELVVIDSNGPICQSNIPPGGIFEPNDCGVEPTTLQLSCGVNYHGNTPPQLELSRELGNTTETFHQGVSCNSTVNEVMCNLTVKTEQKMNGSSIVCRTTRSRSHRCSVNDIKVLHAFNNKEAAEMLLNEKVTCLANCSQICTYKWKWFDYEYGVTISSNSELVPKSDGWYRCEAECQFGNITCPVIARIIHVSTPPKECPGQESQKIISMLSVVIVFQLLLNILVLIIFTRIICPKWFRFCTSIRVGRRRSQPKQTPELGENVELAETNKREEQKTFITQPSDSLDSVHELPAMTEGLKHLPRVKTSTVTPPLLVIEHCQSKPG